MCVRQGTWKAGTGIPLTVQIIPPNKKCLGRGFGTPTTIPPHCNSLPLTYPTKRPLGNAVWHEASGTGFVGGLCHAYGKSFKVSRRAAGSILMRSSITCNSCSERETSSVEL